MLNIQVAYPNDLQAFRDFPLTFKPSSKFFAQVSCALQKVFVANYRLTRLLNPL